MRPTGATQPDLRADSLHRGWGTIVGRAHKGIRERLEHFGVGTIQGDIIVPEPILWNFHGEWLAGVRSLRSLSQRRFHENECRPEWADAAFTDRRRKRSIFGEDHAHVICAIEGNLPLFGDFRPNCGYHRLQIPTSAQSNAGRRESSQTPKTTDSLNEVESTGPEYALKLPANFDRRVGDWDELKKSGVLRLLVLYNKTGFFYDKGRPRGVVPDIADELEVYLNKKLKTGAKKFKIVFIPVTPAELEKDLNEGYGDIIASVVTVTPEREKRVDFSIPIISGLKLVVVSKRTRRRFPVSKT